MYNWYFSEVLAVINKSQMYFQGNLFTLLSPS